MATPAEIYRKQASGEITPAEAARQIAELRKAPATPAATTPGAQDNQAPWYERAYEAVLGSDDPEPVPKRPALDMEGRKDAATLETTIRATGRAAATAETVKAKAAGSDPEEARAAGEEARADVAAKYPLRTGETPEFAAQAWQAIGPRYMGDVIPGVAETGQSIPTRVAQAATGTAGALWHGLSRAAADVVKGQVEAVTPIRFEEPSESDPEGDGVRLMRLFEGPDVGRYGGDAVGHAFESVSAPAFVPPSNPVAMAVTPKGAAEGAALVPIETPAGTALRVVGGADEAMFVAAMRRPMEWTGLLPEREHAWRAQAPWGLGYVSDVLQTLNTGEGIGDVFTEHADYMRPTIESALGPNLGPAAADMYKSNMRSLGRAADFFVPWGSAYAAAGRAATVPARARDLAHATGVDLKSATSAVVGEELPSWITKAKITDVGSAVAARTDATLKAGGDLPPRLKADMADMMARDLDPTLDTMKTEEGAEIRGAQLEDSFLELDTETSPSGLDDLLQAARDPANPEAAVGARRQLVDLAREAAVRRARASLGDDLVVTLPGRKGEPLVVSAKEYESVLEAVTTKAKTLGFNGKDIVEGRLTPPQRAMLYSELRRSGYEGPLPGEIDFTPQREGIAGEGDAPGEVNPGASARWRGPSPIDERSVQEPRPDFDRRAYNIVIESMVERAAGRAAQQRYAIRAYSPLAEYAGRTLAGRDHPLAMPSWYTAVGRSMSPNPATADVPLVLRTGLEHRLRMGEQVASDVRDRIVDRADSGGGLAVMFGEGLISDLPDMAYVDQMKAVAGDIAAEMDARAQAAEMEAEVKAKEKADKQALAEALKTEDQTKKKEYERARTALANKRHELKTERETGRQAKEATLKAANATLEGTKAEAAARLAVEAEVATKSFDEDAAVINFRDTLEREGVAAAKAEDKILAILAAHITDANLLEQAAQVMAANTRSKRWRRDQVPPGQPNPELANGYRREVIEHDDGSPPTTTIHPPDAETAIKAKRKLRAKLVAALGPANPDLAAFKFAWTEFSTASTLHQKAQRDMNEARTTLRKKLNRVNTSVADIRTPFEQRDVEAITRPEGSQLVRDAKELIAEELAAKAAAEAEGPPPPLPLDHPAIAKDDQVKAAQRAADRAARDLAEHDAKVAKLQEDIAKSEARLDAAKVALERHKAAVAAELARAELDRMRENEGSIPAETVTEMARSLAEVDPQVRAMLDAAVAERAGDKEPMTPERKARLELQVLNERIAYERHRAQRLAGQIEAAFVPEARRTHPSDPMSADHADALVKGLLRIPEDDGASLMAQIKTRYGTEAIDDVGGGLFRMAVDRALDAWLQDTVEWMVATGLAIPTKNVDPRFIEAVHNALAGTADIHLGDGRFTSTSPDHFRQAAASLITRWGLSERAITGSDPLATIGKAQEREFGDTRPPESFATAEPLARAVEAARNRAKMPSWAWSETRQFGDTTKRGAIGEATGRALSNWKLNKVIGYTGMRAPAFIFGNMITMPFIMDAALGQRATYSAFGQYARNPAFMSAVLDLHTGGGRWEDPSYQGRYITTKTGRIVSAVDIARAADRFQIDSSQPHVEFARDMYDEVLAALDRPTQIGPLGKLLKGFGIHGQVADMLRHLEVRAKGAGRELAAYHAMIWEMVRAVDSSARLAVLVDQVEQGLSLDHAANSARDSALDYGKLNSFERFTIRRLVPFYAFQRRLLAAYKKNPTAFARHARILRTHEQEYGGDEERGWDANPGRITLHRINTPNGEVVFDTSAPNAGLLDTTLALAGVLRSIVRQEREPGPTVALPGLDESINKLAGQLGPLQTVAEFSSGELGGSGRDLEPGGFEGRMPSWITNNRPLFFLFDAAFDLHPRVNKDPAYGPVGDHQWYVRDPRFYRVFAGLTGLDQEMATGTRYFAASPLGSSPEERAYGAGAPLGIAAHRTVVRPTDMQMTLERAKMQRKVDKEKSDYSHLTPK